MENNSLNEQLESVRAAIKAIEDGGQETETEVNGSRRRVRRGELKDLYKRETFLCREILRCGAQGTYFGVPE